MDCIWGSWKQENYNLYLKWEKDDPILRLKKERLWGVEEKKIWTFIEENIFAGKF